MFEIIINKQNVFVFFCVDNKLVKFGVEIVNRIMYLEFNKEEYLNQSKSEDGPLWQNNYLIQLSGCYLEANFLTKANCYYDLYKNRIIKE